ncbi:hypothetical protein FRB93_008806 [Tulasnella sp. JGI-2019a]|nr:hypothetical protein FRB93_008806 [Tulasnella sp. JGI-2019a]
MVSEIVLTLTVRRPPTKLRSRIAHWAINQSSMQPLNFWPHEDDPYALYKKTKVNANGFLLTLVVLSCRARGLRLSWALIFKSSDTPYGRSFSIVFQGLLATVGFGCFYDSRLSPTSADADTYSINRKKLYIAQTCLTLAVGIQVLVAGPFDRVYFVIVVEFMYEGNSDAARSSKQDSSRRPKASSLSIVRTRTIQHG